MTKFEEKIKEILGRNLQLDMPRPEKAKRIVAKEISSIAYPKEFVEWCIGMITVDDELKNVPLLGESDDLFSYWCDNIDN